MRAATASAFIHERSISSSSCCSRPGKRQLDAAIGDSEDKNREGREEAKTVRHGERVEGLDRRDADSVCQRPCRTSHLSDLSHLAPFALLAPLAPIAPKPALSDPLTPSLALWDRSGQCAAGAPPVCGKDPHPTRARSRNAPQRRQVLAQAGPQQSLRIYETVAPGVPGRASQSHASRYSARARA